MARRRARAGAVRHLAGQVVKTTTRSPRARWGLDGADLVEIDVPGMVFKVGSSDIYSAIRAAIGLGASF